MSGDDDGGIGVVAADDGGQDVIAGRGIHAADGLIQNVELGAAGHDQHQLYLLLVALGKGAELGVHVNGEVGLYLLCSLTELLCDVAEVLL